MKKLIYIAGILLINTVNATEIIRRNYHDGIIQLTIVKVGIESFFTVEMDSSYGTVQELTCGTTFKDNVQLPILRYRNYFNQVVADFNFDKAATCYELRDFLQMTFEGIDEEHPLRFELDLKTKTIAKIIYPDIDPYYQGPYPGLEDNIEYKQLY